MEEVKPKKQSLISKLKDIGEEKEHTLEVLGTLVRLGVVVWSGFIITMNYIDIPMVKKSGNSDITFVASVFTGALATFGLTTGKNGGIRRSSAFRCCDLEWIYYYIKLCRTAND